LSLKHGFTSDLHALALKHAIFLAAWSQDQDHLTLASRQPSHKMCQYDSLLLFEAFETALKSTPLPSPGLPCPIEYEIATSTPVQGHSFKNDTASITDDDDDDSISHLSDSSWSFCSISPHQTNHTSTIDKPDFTALKQP